jgi:hypothetical protein
VGGFGLVAGKERTRLLYQGKPLSLRFNPAALDRLNIHDFLGGWADAPFGSSFPPFGSKEI